MVRLSKRLQAVSEFVPQGARLVDVGTDHAYLPIYLVQSGRIDTAIAADVRDGPLERARAHIAKEALSDVIAVRHSDGLEHIAPGEGDVLVIAGMGGMLMLRILKEGNLSGFSAMILAPQSDYVSFRREIMEIPLRIEKETLVCEDGKYYPVIYAVQGNDTDDDPVHLRYGKRLVPEALHVLTAFLSEEQEAVGTAMNSIREHAAGGREAAERMRELEEICRLNREAQRRIAAVFNGGDMERFIQIRTGDQVLEVPPHTTFRELADRYAPKHDGEVVLVRQDGEPQELFKEVSQDGTLEFVTTDSKEGAMVYRRTGLFLMQKVFFDLKEDPAQTLRVLFTMDQAYYCEVFCGGEKVPVTDAFVKALSERMRNLVSENLPITKRNVPLKEAEAVFDAHGLTDRKRLFRYRTSSRVNLYTVGGYCGYQYGQLMDRTGLLQEFELFTQGEDGGFFLNFPSMYEPDVVDEFVFQPKLFTLQHRDSVWAAQMDLATVGALNDRIASGRMQETVLAQEAIQEQEIGDLAQRIVRDADKKLVLIAGPSSSGKTTFSHRLSIQLLSRGCRPHPVAIDDFFIDRDKMVRRPDGSLDFEALDAVDVAQFNETMCRLLNGETVSMPTFDFREGRQKFTGKTLRIGEGDILVIEGIHGLNPLMTADLSEERKFRIYISALSPLKMDEHNCLSTRDMRLLRRIVRDERTRGASAARTLSMWDSVRRGEEQHIFPFQENADVMFNSSLIYELAVLKQYVEPPLYAIGKDDPAYPEARRLLKLLVYCLGYPSEGIAAHSILREFIGGSCFRI